MRVCRRTLPAPMRWLACASAYIALVHATMPLHADASSWNPTILVNTEAFQIIDDTDEDSDVYIQFGDSIAKSLVYERSFGRFKFDDDLVVEGDLGVAGTASGQVFHANQSLTSSGTLTVDGDAFFRENLTFGSAIGDAITINAGTITFQNVTNIVLSNSVNALSFDTDTLSIDAQNGRVGIGTTTPQATLSVAGTMSGASLQVDDLATEGGLLFGQGAGQAIAQTAQGSSGQLLISQGADAPIWRDPTGSMVWYLPGDQSVGTGKGAVVTMPFAFDATGVTLHAKGAPTGSALIVNIKKNGSTIFSTRPQINDGQTVDSGAHVFSDTSFAAGSVMTVDIDQVGSSFAGSGITIMLNGTRRY